MLALEVLIFLSSDATHGYLIVRVHLIFKTGLFIAILKESG